MDFFEKQDISTYLSHLSLLVDVTSKVQKIQVFEHPVLGKILVLNDEIQNIERWTALYHESIVHIPMMFIKNPRKVLILGGGDLFAAAEVLKYPSVEKVIICDYDPDVIAITEKHYSHAHNVLLDSRIRLVHVDAREYLASTYETFDLIIDDCFNLVDDVFNTTDIFLEIKEKLTEGIGICSSLIYRHILDKETAKRTIERLLIKQRTALSLVFVPEYPGVLHLLTLWGKAKTLSQGLHKSINDFHGSGKINCSFFDPLYCDYYLYLPKYIKNIFLDLGCNLDNV